MQRRHVDGDHLVAAEGGEPDDRARQLLGDEHSLAGVHRVAIILCPPWPGPFLDLRRRVVRGAQMADRVDVQRGHRRSVGLDGGADGEFERFGRSGHANCATLMLKASNIARALTRVSWYSAAGSESATMPPPTWTWISRRATIIVRMARLNSMCPSHET